MHIILGECKALWGELERVSASSFIVGSAMNVSEVLKYFTDVDR